MIKITVVNQYGTFEHETDEYILAFREPDGKMEITGCYKEGFEEELLRDLPTPKFNSKPVEEAPQS